MSVNLPGVMTEESIDVLAAMVGDELESVDAPPPPSGRAKAVKREGWRPNLNPTQALVFDDVAENIIAHGEKGSGKSIGLGHKLVRHAYEMGEALVLIITPMIRTGNEGIWYDLESLILPAWRDGNRDMDGNYLDDGMGLEYTASKMDPLTKDRHRWIRNRHGGWSKLILMSIPHASMVQARIKGPAPSYIYVDELTECDGADYWKFTAAQLGRRRASVNEDKDIPQQFTASCNAKGPLHWVYQTFFVDCMEKDAEGNATDKRDPQFSVYHVPIQENIQWLPKGYVERLRRLFQHDPTEWKRLIEGEWVDMPTGEGIFKGYYSPTLHLQPHDPALILQGMGLEPKRGYPIYIGYDLGSVWQGITFLQCIPTATKNIWMIFDECDHLKEKILFKMLAWEVIERMRYWKKRVGYPFTFCHVTDESAINQYRPGGEGGYDAWEFEREYNRCLAEFGKLGYDGKVEPVQMLGCPKGPGSVAARVRLIQSMLAEEALFVSAQNCDNTVACFANLEHDKDDPMKPKRSPWIHKFDSFSYPIFKLLVGGDPRMALPIARVTTPVKILAMGQS